MSEKRNITKEDIFLKARILSEGIRLKVKKSPEKGTVFRPIVFDGCDLVVTSFAGTRKNTPGIA
jgi:hypothetical protein